MYRIDVSSAVPALPAPAASGAPGYFTDGDVVDGIPATVLPADFMNMIQEELMTVLLAAGIAGSKTSRSQVLAAMRALFAPMSAFTGAEAALGYMQVFGFILQWGFLPSLTNQAINTMNFTVAFPGNPFIMIATPGTSLALGSNAVGMGAAPISQTQGQIAVPSASPGTTGAYWFAIGNKG
jgi:hypothetical protein